MPLLENSREEKESLLAARGTLLLVEKCRRDPLFWLQNYCKTADEHAAGVDPIKPFPMRPYVPAIVKEVTENPIVHIAKSRQMTVSWLIMALILHEAQFNGYKLEAVFSKKEDDAHALVERAKLMYSFQPEWLKEYSPLDRKLRDMPYGSLFFQNGSKIRGFAQGKDQIRSYVPSIAFLDESAFMDKFEETYGACVPCCQRIICVSSANPGYFERLCERV